MPYPYPYTLFRRSAALLLCLLLALVAACTKQDQESQLAQQEKNIDSFISGLINKNAATVVAYTPKSARIILDHGIGDTLAPKDPLAPDEPVVPGITVAPGDTVAFDYVGYVFSGGTGKGLPFATNVAEIVESGEWALSALPPDFGRNVAGRGYFIPGLDSGLLGMYLGEHAYIVFSARHGFGNTEMGVIPKMSPLLFEIYVKEIIKKPESD